MNIPLPVAHITARVLQAVTLRHFFGGVRGQVTVEASQPAAAPVTLKEQLRESIIARCGIDPLERASWTAPEMELVEVILPPNLDVRAMAAQRAADKVAHLDTPIVLALTPERLEEVLGNRYVDVKTATVHHRAVIKDAAAEKGVFDDLDSLEVEVRQFEEVDLRFWDNFYSRISSKNNVLDFQDDADHLFSIKDRYSKGYHPIRKMGLEIDGIVHVTKNSMNALWLVDREAGVFQTVTQTNRFNGATEVGVLEAKAFLNGRY